MIFMSQSGLTVPERRHEWDAWYVEHLRIMKTVAGVDSAQRFRTENENWSPSLAMYSIASPDVFQDPYYQKIRGMGEWLPLIDRRFYIRNLFDGLDRAPEVSKQSVLLVTDQETPASDLPGIRFMWLRAAGLDRSTPFRGIAVANGQVGDNLRGIGEVAIYEPY
jgi:hypothetical protein